MAIRVKAGPSRVEEDGSPVERFMQHRIGPCVERTDRKAESFGRLVSDECLGANEP